MSDILRFPERDRISTGQILSGDAVMLVLHNGNKDMEVLAYCQNGQELIEVLQENFDDILTHKHLFVSIDMVPENFFNLPD